MANFEKKDLTKKSEDFSRWYTDVVLQAELADYAPVRGCMVIRPYGYALWEGVKENLGSMIKDSGVPNAYFPLFIPYSFLEKEQEHVEGFSPETAVVTHGGGKELDEPLVVRPTSETIMYSMFAKWIQSYRDLPLKINQWCNIVRWEKRTYLFLRTLEFLWQEGHTAHATLDNAEKETLDRLYMYQKFVEDILAIPVIVGRKSAAEKFPGALDTFTLEALMPDGKALQCGTSHNLGQNFSKSFKIKYQDQHGELQHVWQTSWGMATRIIGALIMVHGDDQGLKIPPKLAPTQIVIVPIEPEKDSQMQYAKSLSDKLTAANLRVAVDSRVNYTPGYKFNYWELRGVPIRIEIGNREVAEESLTVAKRDTGEKISIPNSAAGEKLPVVLADIQQRLFEQADAFLGENTYQVDDYGEFKQIMQESRGFIKAYWCGSSSCEQKIKDDTKASLRAIPVEEQTFAGEKCICCGKEAKYYPYFAQSY